MQGPAAGARLDTWVARQLPELSRARVQALMAEGAVRLGGRRARPSLRLRGGEEVTVELPDPVAAVPAPEELPLTIVHEDARLLVVDKPAGMTVHPGAGRLSGTLVNALLHHVRDLSGVGGVLRPGIVHRLDRGTSGLMVVAKDDQTHRALAAQFAARGVEKEYLALVSGEVTRAGEVDLPIAQRGARAVVNASAHDGLPATTRFAPERRFRGFTLLRCHAETGRMHQVRAHLAFAGTPIVGDATYGGAAHAGLTGHFLHAARLRLPHPDGGRMVTYEAPLPAERAALLAGLPPTAPRSL